MFSRWSHLKRRVQVPCLADGVIFKRRVQVPCLADGVIFKRRVQVPCLADGVIFKRRVQVPCLADGVIFKRRVQVPCLADGVIFKRPCSGSDVMFRTVVFVQTMRFSVKVSTFNRGSSLRDVFRFCLDVDVSGCHHVLKDVFMLRACSMESS
nr:hypothetical protein BgiMline_034872 [Biomphalaria glabrata]